MEETEVLAHIVMQKLSFCLFPIECYIAFQSNTVPIRCTIVNTQYKWTEMKKYYKCRKCIQTGLDNNGDPFWISWHHLNFISLPISTMLLLIHTNYQVDNLSKAVTTENFLISYRLRLELLRKRINLTITKFIKALIWNESAMKNERHCFIVSYWIYFKFWN